MLTVICPIYNEENRIEECIRSVIAQDWPKEELEVLFVDGMSGDRTREIVKEYSQQYPFIQLLDNPKRIAPSGLNIGIRAAKGEIILRLDAHAKYPNNYFSVLVNKLQETGADNVGGACRTLPAKDTPECRAIAHAMSSPFGMGNSYFRIGADCEKWVDTVPFGCFRRDVFDKIGLFDEELVRNQDDEFNGRIIQNGGKILLLPQVVTDYFARKDVLPIWVVQTIGKQKITKTNNPTAILPATLCGRHSFRRGAQPVQLHYTVDISSHISALHPDRLFCRTAVHTSLARHLVDARGFCRHPRLLRMWLLDRIIQNAGTQQVHGTV